MSSPADMIRMHRDFVMSTYAPNRLLVQGEGTKVWDAEGREYLDFAGGIAVISVGHCHPTLVAAIREQAGRLMHVSNLFYNENQPRLAGELVARFVPGSKVFFCNSGAEANEGLFKLARLWGHDRGKYEVVSMRNSFHGRTLAAITATGQAKYQKGFEPLPAGFVHADYNDLASVEEAVSDKTVAVIVEAVQGEGGVVPATPEFMRGLRELCDRREVLLFCDEVQCGMGRTGRWFGFQNYGIAPDGFSLAKGLGGGFPIGALVAGPKLADVFRPGHHASTFGGTPLACAAALAVLRIIEEEHLLDRALKMGARLRAGLESLAAKHAWVAGVRGTGLMVGLALDRPAKPLEGLLLERGLITIATGEKVIRMVPPLTVSEAEIDRALGILSDACAASPA
jgi:acetylornithine/N-succinyldiaminopimelate aminotransferase